MIDIPDPLRGGPSGVTINVILKHIDGGADMPIEKSCVELKCDRRLSVSETLQVAMVLERAARLAEESLGHSFGQPRPLKGKRDDCVSTNPTVDDFGTITR